MKKPTRRDALLATAATGAVAATRAKAQTTLALEAAGVDLYLDQQNIDTTTPIGSAFAEFERTMIKTRVRAGMQTVKETLARDGKFVSQPF